MSLPLATLLLAIAILLIGGMGPNLLLALLSVVVLVVGTTLLWRPGESPILLFIFALPWVQASIAVYHANWLGISIADYSPFFGDTETAVALSLASLVALALGMRLGAGPQRPEDVLRPSQMALSQPLQRWFRLYAVAWLASLLARSFAWVVPGLSQPMLALAGMKWAFFYMLAAAYFVRGGGGGWLFPLVFLFELVTALGGYFSDFKTVFFVTLFAAVASGVRFSPRALIGSALLTALVISLGIVWSSVKGDFRAFVSGGESQQIVTVDYLTRMGKLAELVRNLDGASLANGTDQFLRRLGYVNFFGLTLLNVPFSHPHTEGAILEDAIVRPFMPRLFFADKGAIDDKVRTNFYTDGRAGTSEGTSISLGYIAEAYIDFGQYGMLAELLGIGFFYGVVYRKLLRWRRSGRLLGNAIATAALITVGSMDNSFTKVFGGVIVSLLAASVIAAFVVPRWAPWLVPGRR